MAKTNPPRPCPLHTGYRLNTQHLRDHNIKIHDENDDLVCEDDRMGVDGTGNSVWEEKAIALVCEACYVLGHYAYMESLETRLRGELLGYRVQLPGRKRKWAVLNGEQASWHGPPEYSTVGFCGIDGTISLTLRFILVKNYQMMAHLHLGPGDMQSLDEQRAYVTRSNARPSVHTPASGSITVAPVTSVSPSLPIIPTLPTQEEFAPIAPMLGPRADSQGVSPQPSTSAGVQTIAPAALVIPQPVSLHSHFPEVSTPPLVRERSTLGSSRSTAASPSSPTALSGYSSRDSIEIIDEGVFSTRPSPLHSFNEHNAEDLDDFEKEMAEYEKEIAMSKQTLHEVQELVRKTKRQKIAGIRETIDKCKRMI